MLLIILGLGFYFNNQQQKQPQESYQFPSPEAVVRQYFEAWNAGDYVNMYAAISDGFKRIEPTAKDLSTFRAYAQAQGINEVKIISLQEKMNDGSTAAIDYEVEFIFNDGKNEGKDDGKNDRKNDRKKQPFKGTFTLKYRPGDIIQGWKLIHPYGEKVDTS